MGCDPWRKSGCPNVTSTHVRGRFTPPRHVTPGKNTWFPRPLPCFHGEYVAPGVVKRTDGTYVSCGGPSRWISRSSSGSSMPRSALPKPGGHAGREPTRDEVEWIAWMSAQLRHHPAKERESPNYLLDQNKVRFKIGILGST